MRIWVNGVRLYFDIDGAGLLAQEWGMQEVPTVILLHGGPGADHSIYKPDFTAPTDVAQVIYLDIVAMVAAMMVRQSFGRWRSGRMIWWRFVMRWGS